MTTSPATTAPTCTTYHARDYTTDPRRFRIDAHKREEVLANMTAAVMEQLRSLVPGADAEEIAEFAEATAKKAFYRAFKVNAATNPPTGRSVVHE